MSSLVTEASQKNCGAKKLICALLKYIQKPLLNAMSSK